MPDHSQYLKIVCTREEARNRAIIGDLAREGIEAVSLPLITTTAVPLSIIEQNTLVAALNDDTCVLCVTSPNGVRYLFATTPHPPTPLRCRVAVQGHATAEAWKSLTGFAPSIIAQGSTGSELGKTILAHESGLKRALLISPAEPRPELAAVLSHGGLTVQRLAVYRTDACAVCLEAKRAFAEMGECLVLFFSPSSVRSFVDAQLHQVNEHALYASFGPTTATALRDNGLLVALEHHKGEQSAFIEEIRELAKSRGR